MQNGIESRSHKEGQKAPLQAISHGLIDALLKVSISALWPIKVPKGLLHICMTVVVHFDLLLKVSCRWKRRNSKPKASNEREFLLK